MEIVNNSENVTSGNWNVNGFDVSSLKMTIDNSKMDVIIYSQNLQKKEDYNVEVKDGKLCVKLNPKEKNVVSSYERKFLLPYPDFKYITNNTFVKGQIKVELAKEKKQYSPKKLKYSSVA